MYVRSLDWGSGLVSMPKFQVLKKRLLQVECPSFKPVRECRLRVGDEETEWMAVDIRSFGCGRGEMWSITAKTLNY